MKTRTDNKGKCYRVMGALLITLFGLCVCVTSCNSDDDDKVPSYFIDLVEADTNTDSLVSLIRLDNGKTYQVSQSIKAPVPDTTYRCLCTYELDSNKILAYGLEHVFSSKPRKVAAFDTLITDPVKFISSWKSGGYLNLQIGVMTTDADYHQFAFCEDTIADNGTYKTACFTLVHKRPKKDNESYTKTMFLCIPISSYTDCDSFAVRVNTYEGLRQIVR